MSASGVERWKATNIRWNSFYSNKFGPYIAAHLDDDETPLGVQFLQMVNNYIEAYKFTTSQSEIPNFPVVAHICLQIINEGLAKIIIRHGRKRDIMLILWERYLPDHVAFMDKMYLKRNDIEHDFADYTMLDVIKSMHEPDETDHHNYILFYELTITLLEKCADDLLARFAE